MIYPDIVAVIPAYNPEETLIGLVGHLHGYLPVVLVNDGSESPAVFERLPKGQGLTVLVHDANRGKGAALKTAFQYVLERHPGAAGVVTLDSDGQHLPDDALKIARRLHERRTSLIFGVRRFEGGVPLRSRFGNRLTRRLVRVLLGIRLSDTQTGLRGIPRELLPVILKISFDRYELETEMLRTLKNSGLAFEEVPIRTVYLEGNRSSHFRPLLDSMRIYWVLFRHVLAGISAAVVDFGVYLTALAVSGHILSSVCLGRLASLLVNFSLVKIFAFRSRKRAARELLLYLLQVAVMIFVATSLVNLAQSVLGIAPSVSKIPVDLLLYPVNFLVQKFWIFRSSPTLPGGVGAGVRRT